MLERKQYILSDSPERSQYIKEKRKLKNVNSVLSVIFKRLYNTKLTLYASLFLSFEDKCFIVFVFKHNAFKHPLEK